MEEMKDLPFEAGSNYKEVERMFPVERFEYPHGKLDVRDIMPENVRDEVPLISNLGFGTDNSTITPTLSELFYLGQHTVAVDIAGGGKQVEADGGNTELNRQGELLNEFINDYLEKNPQIDQVDIMTQSFSLMRILALAKLHPETIPKIRNLIMFVPVGFDEKDSSHGLILRQIAEMGRFGSEQKRRQNNAEKAGVEKSDEQKETDKVFSRRLQKTFLKASTVGLKRSFKELFAMSKANKYPEIKDLRKKGVKIAIVQGSDDKLASFDRLNKVLTDQYKNEQKPIKQAINLLTEETSYVYEPSNIDSELPPVDILHIAAGGHEVQASKPQKIARAITTIVDNLKNPPKYPLNRDKDFNTIS